MTQQTEAQRLAAELEAGDIHECAWQAAAELRRQETVIARLLEALYNMVEDGDETDKQQALAAIAAAKEQA